MFEKKGKVVMYCRDGEKTFWALKGELITCSCPMCGALNQRIVVYYPGVV